MKTLKKTAAVLLLLALCLFGCAAPKEAAAPEAPIRALLEKIYNGPDETITKRLAELSGGALVAGEEAVSSPEQQAAIDDCRAAWAEEKKLCTEGAFDLFANQMFLTDLMAAENGAAIKMTECRIEARSEQSATYTFEVEGEFIGDSTEPFTVKGRAQINGDGLVNSLVFEEDSTVEAINRLA